MNSAFAYIIPITQPTEVITVRFSDISTLGFGFKEYFIQKIILKIMKPYNSSNSSNQMSK